MFFFLYFLVLIFRLSCDDFVKIVDKTDSKLFCGKEREAYTNQFCSNEISIEYSAVWPKPYLDTIVYKGFNLYFEGTTYVIYRF